MIVVDRFTVHGSAEECAAKVGELAALGVTEYNIYTTVPEPERVIEAYGREIIPVFNRVGVDRGGGPTDFYGRAFFTDPGGEIVAQLGSEQDAILHVEIDTEVSATMRDE